MNLRRERHLSPEQGLLSEAEPQIAHNVIANIENLFIEYNVLFFNLLLGDGSKLNLKRSLARRSICTTLGSKVSSLE